MATDQTPEPEVQSTKKLHAAPPEERHTKPAVDPSELAFRDLREDEFWRAIPAFSEIDRETFLDYKWQMKHSVYGADQLIETVRDIAPDDWLEDAVEGFNRAPMAVRVTPRSDSQAEKVPPTSSSGSPAEKPSRVMVATRGCA